jgi:hypothetical protein
MKTLMTSIMERTELRYADLLVVGYFDNREGQAITWDSLEALAEWIRLPVLDQSSIQTA